MNEQTARATLAIERMVLISVEEYRRLLVLALIAELRERRHQ